ncbi:MAG: PAS domain-containing protein [Shimia sp.]|uniref:PAS domain-containing protein n=1 Tax=Shimia sp. TaxID=1954381 RepID=UPI003B8CA86B
MNAMTKISSASADSSATEVRFANESIITSATDPRGVIQFANDKFVEVGGYSLEELINAPHKIMRHPDMPKGVFYLMWECLKAGQPICTYVKNKTKSGGYYWVLAVVTQTENGFLSARIRPGTELFETTKEMYVSLLQEEKDKNLTPEQSGARLLEMIKEAGYPTLEAYGIEALNLEFKNRNIIEPNLVNSFSLMDELAEIISDMQDLVNSIEQGFERVRGEPVNLRILAGRLEGAGAALGTISQNYDAMAKEMHGLVGRLHDPENGSLVQMYSAVSHGRWSMQIAQLLGEAYDNVQPEDKETDGANLLKEHHERMQQRSRSRLIEISSIGKSIPDICRSLRRRINGLDVVKLLCKVESGRMRDVDSGLDGIIARLENFHDNTDRHLADLSAKASQVTQKGSSL